MSSALYGGAYRNVKRTEGRLSLFLLRSLRLRLRRRIIGFSFLIALVGAHARRIRRFRVVRLLRLLTAGFGCLVVAVIIVGATTV